ncbi:MAG: hypothetical protein NWE89_03745 [Candidatus Bathyarchaeota archaeon]|nr:hypothetical protein [Candidatus Bathyarchaeota archaeon]
MSEKNTLYLAIIAIVISVLAIGLTYTSEAPAGLTGPEGPQGVTGPAGPAGPAGPPGASVTLAAEPESCATCHEGAGAEHQASYDELNQDSITVTDMAYEYTAPNTHTVTFTMLKDGEPFDPADADRVRMYYVPWTGTAFQYEPAASRLALTGTMTFDSVTGGVTSTLTDDDPRYASSFDDMDGAIMLYGYDGGVARMPNSRVQQAKYPIGGLLETGDGIDDVSAANVEGCERCHSVPYLKHGYYITQFNDDPTTDFILCKACHMENTDGGHYEWQLLVDDPVKAVEWLESDEDTSIFTVEQLAQLEYAPTLMNDVHMSHAMEFPYPQSMSNCIVCHEDKLDVILTEDNFNMETCKSCHAVTGSEEYGTDEFALTNLLPSPIHDAMDLETTDCSGCHSDGSAMGDFEDIHPGYDTLIYASLDLKYSDAIVITIDDASVANDLVTVQFSATEVTDLAGFDVEDIVPTVMVGMYGWDTKDFIIGPHERLVDDNNDGEISRSSGDNRALEYEAGDEDHPRGTTVLAAGGSWEVVLDMSTWGDLIDDGTVSRLEIAVMPELEDADGDVITLDAPSRTFDLATDDFDDDYYSPIVDIEGCYNCHDAIGEPYHGGDRAGSIVVCRLCHITKADGSHIEMQSRSLDSYVHAIHSMQPFDIGDIDFTDAVEELHYEHHIGFPYPTHGITNCESCHVEGTYEVPDQTKSLPGLISASDSLEGWDRDIEEVPEYATGPAARACGGCHRAELINEDDASGLASFYQHMKAGGYLIEVVDDEIATIMEVIDEIMAYFK